MDAWELSGAYLLMGQQQLVLDSFDFIQASQRDDGHIPIAIVSAETEPEGMSTFFRGINYPKDVYSYHPAVDSNRIDISGSSGHKWIGLFKHWQTNVNPLGVLGPISYILTASDIFFHTRLDKWLSEKIDSIKRAALYVRSQRSANGLIGCAGFYIECPPRNQWDGVTQCYASYAFKMMSRLYRSLGFVTK